jgi:6,7-dimethyl-8-ribityllumazine synthase
MVAPEIKPHILIVEARFYEEISDELAKGAVAALKSAGVTFDRLAVPGAFEIPAAIRMAIHAMDFYPHRRRYDGYVALGCVIRGETTHYETVCADSSRGLTLLGLDGLCIGNGILTVENHGQAAVRADPAGHNKGGGAADAALHLIALARRFARPVRPLPEGSVRVAGETGVV